MNLLQMSLSGAVMILVIVVIRALAINKLPKKTFLILWGVVVVRLLIPYSFRSAFSAYSLLGHFTPTTVTGNGGLATPFTPLVPTHNMASLPGTSTTHATAATVNPWVVVWGIGVLACAVFFTITYLKCRKEFKASLPVDNKYVKQWLNEHHIYRTIEIRQSGRISAPLTYGVFRPIILMPKNTDWDDMDMLKFVLAHEYVHIRRFDAMIKLMLTAALCIHWFNPVVWIMYIFANRDLELSCDEAVIRKFGQHTKSAYARTLIRMEEARSSLTPFYNNFSKNVIEERIVAIMKIKKISWLVLIVAGALIIGVTIAFATSAAWRENEKIELVYDEEMGYDLTELLGKNMDDVLEAFEKAGVEIQTSMYSWPEQGTYIYDMQDIQYGFETQIMMAFHKLEDSKETLFSSYREEIRLAKWPEVEEEISQMVIKQFADLIKVYGEPTSKSPTLQDPTRIMDTPASRSAVWEIDDGKILIDFSVHGDSDLFVFCISMTDQEI